MNSNRFSEEPHKHLLNYLPIDGVVRCAQVCPACAYAEGRKSMEKEIEEKKAIKDALLCGTGFVREGKRVPPEDVYLSETEIKLKKAEKDFKEILEMVNRFRHGTRYSGGLKWVIDFEQEFDAWKKARGMI